MINPEFDTEFVDISILADPELLGVDISKDSDIEEGDCFTQILDPVFGVHDCFKVFDLLKTVGLCDNKHIIDVEKENDLRLLVDKDAGFIWAVFKPQTVEKRDELIEP